MQWIAALPLERRLQERYRILVQAHMRCATTLAAGVASLPGVASSFAATQGAWRFLNNPRVSLAALAEPLRAAGRDRACRSRSNFVMLVHDWSKLSFGQERRKQDRVQLTHETDVGYELSTALLVSGDDGSPLAPMEMRLKTARGMLSTGAAARSRPHLGQILPTMKASRSWGLSKPIVHVIDREADSVDHYRRWDAQGEKFLIRADDRRVRWEGESFLLSAIVSTLRRGKEPAHVGAASCRGQAAQLWVVETEVVLHRPAKKNTRGKRSQLPGRALALRLILAELREPETGKVQAQWTLLSNVPQAWATSEHLARCYYWRWRIESFFKLLKSHGQQLERWQQESGAAIARRLLVAAMACVTVWQLQADDSPAALKFKNVLVRLSGRQTKRQRAPTAPALLAGLWVMLSMLSLLEQDNLRQLKRLTEKL